MRAPPQKEIKERGIKEKRRPGRKRRISIGVENQVHRQQKYRKVNDNPKSINPGYPLLPKTIIKRPTITVTVPTT